MINEIFSASTSKDCKLSHCSTDCGNISHQPPAKEKIVVGEKGIELCLGEEKTDFDYLWKRIASTSKTFSMDSSDISDDTSVESVKGDTDSTSAADFDDVSVEMHMESTMHTDTDCMIAPDVYECRKSEQNKPSVSKSLGECLHLEAVESSKRLAILGKSLRESIEMHHDTASTLINKSMTIDKNELSTTGLVEFAPKSISTSNCVQTGKQLKTVKWNDTIQMKDVTFNVDPDNNIGKRKESISEIAVNVTGRNKKLASFRRQNLANRPKLNIGSAERCPLLLSNEDCNSSVNDNSSNVYNDNSIEQEKLSVSEMAGCRLYLEALRRKERLALLRKEHNNHQPNLLLVNSSTVSESRGDDKNGVESGSKCGEKFQRLYALSKRMQEDGKKRRKDIEEAIAKAHEEWTHPTDKISIVESTRLYYMGMQQIIDRERKVMKASKPGQYKPRALRALSV